MDREKILLLIPNLDFGGAQKVFFDYAKLLSKKYEVKACVFNLEKYSVLDPEVDVISLNIPAGKNVLDKMFRFCQRCIKLFWIKKHGSYTITVSHLEGADYVNLLSFGKGKKILVVHGSKIHDNEIDSSFGFLRKKILIPFLYPFADHIFTVSNYIKAELVQSFKLSESKITTIYNSFSIAQLMELYKEEHELDVDEVDSLKLITAGRLAKQKNQIALLYILQKLKNKLKTQLYIVGDGPQKKALIAECLKLDLSYAEFSNDMREKGFDVIFLGYHKNPLKFYKDMDLFLLPSRWEGFPLALGEAMAVGMPVLASDCPTGPKEILLIGNNKDMQNAYTSVSNKAGVLLPIPLVDDPNSLCKWTEAIVKVYNKPTMKEMGFNAKIRMKQFDKSVIEKQLYANIAKILNR